MCLGALELPSILQSALQLAFVPSRSTSGKLIQFPVLKCMSLGGLDSLDQALILLSRELRGRTQEAETATEQNNWN